MKYCGHFLRTAACLVASCSLLGLPVLAQEQKPARSKNAAAAQAPSAVAEKRGTELTALDVEAFLDGLLPQQIEKGDIAGTVIVVVKDGKVLFEKGYGYADAEK